MRFDFDRLSPTPLYRQIEDQLRRGIQAATLAPGTRLPAVRALAADLGVSRITVETAYTGLEADGLVERRVGSGTYVLGPAAPGSPPAPQPGAALPLWQSGLEPLRRAPAGGRLDELRRTPLHPDPIDLSVGSGDAGLFPSEDFRRALQTVMRRDGIAALEYGDRAGYLPLRETIARVLSAQGIQTRPESLLVTGGSQQGLALALRLLARPGDSVLAESPTYSGVLDLFRSLGLRVVGVPVDERGMQVEGIEPLLQTHHPRLIYSIPNFQNPTGTCLSLARRKTLLALAERYNLPLIEDDFVGDLRYEGRAQPALKSLDPGGRVIYISSFSKMLMPGIRVGFLAAEGPVYDALLDVKTVDDLATSNLVQRALEAYVTVGSYQAHLRRSCQVYRRRRDALIEAVRRYLPDEVAFNLPQGGLFVWARLPGGVRAEDLLERAVVRGVLFAPGAGFFPEAGAGSAYLRLNFAAHPPERLVEGVRRLALALED